MFSDLHASFIGFPVFLANAGTPLMMMGMLHLVFGNALIGLLEAWLISKWFGVKNRALIPALITANYVSAYVGYFLLTKVFRKHVDLTIENLLLWMALLVVIAFVLTLLIEFLFFWAVLRRHALSFGKSVKATVVVHLASYALMLGGYWMLSSADMATKLQIVDRESIAPAGVFSLFYITPDGKEVRRMDMKSGNSDQIAVLDETLFVDRLMVTEKANGKFDLAVIPLREHHEITILRDMPDRFAREDGNSETDYQPLRKHSFWNYGKVPKFDVKSPWNYQSSFYAMGGINGRNEKDSSSFAFAIETPLVSWEVRNAVHLPDDSVLFQLGSDQICLLRPQERKLALIARGRGPVVAIPVHPGNVVNPVNISPAVTNTSLQN